MSPAAPETPQAHVASAVFRNAEFRLEVGEKAIAARAAVRTSPAEYSTAHGAVTAATALPPLLWLGFLGRRAWVRRRRRRLGLCQRCGYDLRGSPSGRCSECGVWMKGSAGDAGGNDGADH